LGTELSVTNAGIQGQPRSNPCIALGASVEQGVIPDRGKVQKVGTGNSGVDDAQQVNIPALTVKVEPMHVLFQGRSPD